MILKCLSRRNILSRHIWAISEQVGTIKVWFPLMVLTSQISGLGPRTICLFVTNNGTNAKRV